MIRQGLLVGISFLPLVGTTQAQTPEYRLHNEACNGSWRDTLYWNSASPSIGGTAVPGDFAFPIVNPRAYPIQVLAFRCYTRTAAGTGVLVPARFYRDAQGTGATSHTVPATTPEATGHLVVTLFAAWYGASVYAAPVLQPGEACWVGFESGGVVIPPLNLNGSSSPAQPRYRQPNVANNAWLPYAAAGFPAIELVHTTASPRVPMLSSPDLPRIGQPFRIVAGNGTPSSPAFLTIGGNGFLWNGQPLPVNLSPMGADDCFLHTTSDVLMAVPTDAQGSFTFQFVIPANAALVGFVFTNQAALMRPVNALGLVTTNSAVGRIGV